MKDVARKSFLEARTVALLTGLATGLGIIVHEAFFVVALGIILIAGIEFIVEARDQHIAQT